MRSLLRCLVISVVSLLFIGSLTLKANDSTYTDISTLRVLDLDDDGTEDTVDVSSVWRVVKAKRVFASRMIQSIRWGDDTPTTDDDRDTTLFNLPLNKHYRTAIRFYDYNRDDIPDIVVSWNWEGDSSRNKHRMLVFTGGDALREETLITMGTLNSARPNKSSVIEVSIDTAKHQPVGVGGYYFRKRPMSAVLPKPPAARETVDENMDNDMVVHASPNPIGESVRVTVSNNSSGIAEVSLLTLEGSSVLSSRKLEDGSVVLRTAGIASGTYLISVTTDSGERASLRVVIQH